MQTHPRSPDGAAVGLATVGGPVAAVGAGIAFALGLSVKLTAVTAVPPLHLVSCADEARRCRGGRGRGRRAAALHAGNWEACGRALSLPRGCALDSGGHPASAPPDFRPDPAPDALLLACGRGCPTRRHRDRAAPPTDSSAALALERTDGRLLSSTRHSTTTTYPLPRRAGSRGGCDPGSSPTTSPALGAGCPGARRSLCSTVAPSRISDSASHLRTWQRRTRLNADPAWKPDHRRRADYLVRRHRQVVGQLVDLATLRFDSDPHRQEGAVRTARGLRGRRLA